MRLVPIRFGPLIMVATAAVASIFRKMIIFYYTDRMIITRMFLIGRVRQPGC